MTEGLKATSQLIVAIDSAIDQQTRTRHEDFHVPVARREEDKDEESLLSKFLLILHSVRTLSREREREGRHDSQVCASSQYPGESRGYAFCTPQRARRAPLQVPSLVFFRYQSVFLIPNDDCIVIITFFF